MSMTPLLLPTFRGCRAQRLDTGDGSQAESHWRCLTCTETEPTFASLQQKARIAMSCNRWLLEMTAAGSMEAYSNLDAIAVC